ncbi:hypothetical protein PInf_011067 [Phytophthora infestans]|nr:hypothetical protein PInf_011067 [Phytophthora infestans]
MVHLRHPGLHWKVRCVLDSDDENTPPNVMQGRASPETKEVPDSQSTESDLASSGSATPPWLSPGFTDRVPKDKSNLPSSQDLSGCNSQSGKWITAWQSPPKVFLGRNVRTSSLAMVAAEVIGVGEVIGSISATVFGELGTRGTKDIDW